jgi:hypothetical protein
MNVSRDVITDLLPLYLAGEASADTRALVEAFFQADPEFARLAVQPAPVFAQPPPAISGDSELQALRSTQALLRRRTLLLAFALFFSLFSVAFRFDHQGAYWLWSDQPILGAVCLGLGLVCAYLGWRRK